MKQVLMIIIAK